MTAQQGLQWVLHDLAMRLVCPRCKAQAHQPCRTLAGRPCAYLHGPRRSPVDVAYATGYTEGTHDGMASARRKLGLQ